LVTRVPALKFIAASVGDSLVTWEHNARTLNAAPGQYDTALGRGLRHAHVNLHWLASTFLNGVIGDPKNAAIEVPRYGELQRSGSKLESREVTYEGNALNLSGRSFTASHEIPFDALSLPKDETFFDAFANDINLVAHQWNSERHKAIDGTYEAEINIGPSPFIKVSVKQSQDRAVEWWLHHFYSTPSEGAKVIASGPLMPIRRRVVITGKHITMLAALWADTLEHMNASGMNSEPLPADGGLGREKSARPKTTKTARAATPAVSQTKIGSPANPSQASQQTQHDSHTLSLSKEARVAAALDAQADLLRDRFLPANPELTRNVRSRKIPR